MGTVLDGIEGIAQITGHDENVVLELLVRSGMPLWPWCEMTERRGVLVLGQFPVLLGGKLLEHLMVQVSVCGSGSIFLGFLGLHPTSDADGITMGHR